MSCDVKVPSRVVVEGEYLPSIVLHRLRQVGRAAVDLPEDPSAFLMGIENFLHGLLVLLVEAVELHVHGLDELRGDLTANGRRVLGVGLVQGVVGEGLVLGSLVLQEGGLRWCPVGHREVLVDGDVLVQVLIVVDGITGVACHVVEADVLPFGIVSNSMIQAKKVFTSFTHGGIFPFSILDGNLVEVVVDLDVEGLQDWSANQ